MKRKQYTRIGTIILLFVIQILFLLAIFRENAHSYLLAILVASLVLLVLYTYRKGNLHADGHEFESYKIAVWVPAGSVFCFFLNQELGLGPVLAAALTGTLASLLTYIRWHKAYFQHLPPAIYCGAFVGMSDASVATDVTFVLTAGCFTAIFLVVSKSVLKGIGGKPGTLAFLGVTLTYMLIYIFRQ